MIEEINKIFFNLKVTRFTKQMDETKFISNYSKNRVCIPSNPKYDTYLQNKKIRGVRWNNAVGTRGGWTIPKENTQKLIDLIKELSSPEVDDDGEEENTQEVNEIDNEEEDVDEKDDVEEEDSKQESNIRQQYPPQSRDREYYPQSRDRDYYPQSRDREYYNQPPSQSRDREYYPQSRDRDYYPQSRDRDYYNHPPPQSRDRDYYNHPPPQSRDRDYYNHPPPQSRDRDYYPQSRELRSMSQREYDNVERLRRSVKDIDLPNFSEEQLLSKPMHDPMNLRSEQFLRDSADEYNIDPRVNSYYEDFSKKPKNKKQVKREEREERRDFSDSEDDSDFSDDFPEWKEMERSLREMQSKLKDAKKRSRSRGKRRDKSRQ